MNNLEDYQRRFENEVTSAAIAFYTWKGINDVASQDERIRAALNKDAAVWNAILHSLQTTALITIGRIFDTDHGALSVHTLLRKCLSEIEHFSPNGLRQRKIAASKGMPTPWLSDYIAAAFYPSKDDFRNLKRVASRFQKMYEEIYKPIRNQVLAHKELAAIDNVGTLFAKTRIGDIQQTLEFLHQLSEVIFHYLHNGQKTELHDHHFNKEDEVRQNIKMLLARITT